MAGIANIGGEWARLNHFERHVNMYMHVKLLYLTEMQFLGSRVAMLRGRLDQRCGRCGRNENGKQ